MRGRGLVTGSLALGILLVSVCAGAAQRQRTDEPSRMDKQFMMKAAQGNMAEVALGKLATERAASDAVKEFGQRMVQDHGKANGELKQLADQKDVALPSDVDAEAEQTMDRLSDLSGAEFDRAYVQAMMKEHRKDISAFQREARQGTDREVSQWATKTLPILQQHLTMVQQLAPQVGIASENGQGGGTSGSSQ